MPTRNKRNKKRRVALRTGETGVSASNALRRRTRRSAKPLKTGIVELKEDNIITSRLSGHPKPNAFRYGKYLHVSDLLGKCMRMVALSYRTATEIAGEPLWDNMLVTFAIGNGIHDAVRDKMQITRPGEMYGVWKCKCKDAPKSFEGIFTDAAKQKSCRKCGHDLDTYDELVLPNEDVEVVGSVDLTLFFDRAYYFTEIKSIKKEDWDSLVRPIPLHILQVVFYWWLAKELGKPIHKQVSILYTTKGHVFSSPHKEFILDPTEHLHRLDDYLEDAKALMESRKGGALPLRLCPTPNSPQAKKCEMCSICFNVD